MIGEYPALSEQDIESIIAQMGGHHEQPVTAVVVDLDRLAI